MSVAAALIQYAASGGRDVGPVVEALADSRARARTQHQEPMEVDRPSHAPARSHGSLNYPGQQVGETYVLPTHWKGTHVTDGLGWGTRTAEDIMLKPYTPLGAPEPGHIVYYHPTGAQGGGSILYDPDAPGPDYWIGHILGSAPIGRRLRRGQRLTSISPDHAAPHAHIDRGG